MENRCDSVDALMYAYYEMMRFKEENKMLKKNKDYIEFSMWSYMATHKPGQCTDINLTGISPEPGVLYTNNPFDIPCDVVVISKRAFDRLQADDQCHRELAKQREENYRELLDKTGFYNLADLMSQLPKDKTLKDIIDSCDAENKKLKQKLHEFDPVPDFKELFKKLYSIEDTEALEWALNHTVGGRGSVNGWRAVSLFWSEKYKTLSKLVGFSSAEEIEDYLTNEAECDTLHEAISKLHDQVKYTCDEWYSANSRNNSWKAAAECNSPKELIKKLNLLHNDIAGRIAVIKTFSRALKDWKEITGYPSPSAVKTALESGVSWCHAYNEIKKANEKLADTIKQWQEATGCSTPEEAKTLIASGYAKLGSSDGAWRGATCCDSPLEANILINNNKDAIRKWKAMTKCETPEAAATWITSYESACERGNKLAEEVEEWKKATGRISPEAAKQYINRLKGRLNAIHGYSVDW